MSSGFPGLTRVQRPKRPYATAFLNDQHSPSPTPPPAPAQKAPLRSVQLQKQKSKPLPPPEPSPDPRESLDEDVLENDPHIVRAYRALDHKALLMTRLAGGYEHMYQAARLLPRLVGTFVDYDTVLSKGLARYGTYSPDDPDYAKRVFNEYWEVRYYFRKINAKFPGLSDHHRFLSEDTDLIARMATFMTSVAGKARSDDAGRVCKYIYAIAGWKDELLRIKTERGFNNTTTGRLLCPVTKLDKFDDDPQKFCRYVRDRIDSPDRVWITADDWPSFIYDEDQHIQGEVKTGLLRSKLLLNCYKVVFTGPESAVPSLPSHGRKRPKGKPPIIKRFAEPATTFTIYAIVYVACLVRYALNAEDEWTDDDGDFFGRDFVRTLLTLAIRNTEWQRELGNWYKRHVLDKPNGEKPPPNRRTAYEIMMEEDDVRTLNDGNGPASQEVQDDPELEEDGAASQLEYV